MSQNPIENPVINSPFVEPQRHFVTRRRPSHRRDRTIAAGRPSSSSRSRSPRRSGRAARRSTQFGTADTPAAERDRQRDPPGGRALAPAGLPAHHHDHPRPARVLAERGPRAPPVLLPDRGRRDGDLPDRGGREARRHQRAQRRSRSRTPHYNGGLPRLAFKMATGSGKTVVMAMLIAWQTLNKLANPQDRRFSDKFLVVTPGHHHPRPPARAAAQRPAELLPGDGPRHRRSRSTASSRRTIVITNFHAFIRREKIAGGEPDQEDPRRRGEDDDRVQGDAGGDGPPRLPRLRQRQEHRRHQRRGAPLLRSRRPRTRRSETPRAPTSASWPSRTRRRRASG